jgi:hypothetical protein
MTPQACLVDTSVWIGFFNGQDHPNVDFLDQLIRDDVPAFLCPLIVQEILQGIRMDADFKKVRDSLLAFPILEWDPVEAAIAAAELYRDLRKKGITVRKSNDCLIAAFARQADLPVLHIDRDFSKIASGGFIKEIKEPN